MTVPIELPPLTLTGERTLPGIDVENYWYRRHEAVYLAVAGFCRGAVVVDAGCGEGYGAALLHRLGAGRVIGTDLAPEAVAHAAARYPFVDFVRADSAQLPLAGAAAEVVVSSQVIEHLDDQPGFVAECARVLRPAGTLVLSTPNRFTFSPGLARAVNPFHTRELSADELVALVADDFEVARLLGVSHGSRLRRWERRHGSLVAAQLAVPPESWPPSLRSTVSSVTADDFRLSPHGVDSALDLVIVGIRRTACRAS
ncbi:MAG TPA: class I SAM-dependent methyltransferase [Mycobacteriales bacterium]|nr:class I SAM-dependent methyltransferase [Mycobacteriales bacterium]